MSLAREGGNIISYGKVSMVRAVVIEKWQLLFLSPGCLFAAEKEAGWLASIESET